MLFWFLIGYPLMFQSWSGSPPLLEAA